MENFGHHHSRILGKRGINLLLKLTITTITQQNTTKPINTTMKSVAKVLLLAVVRKSTEHFNFENYNRLIFYYNILCLMENCLHMFHIILSSCGNEIKSHFHIIEVKFLVLLTKLVYYF